MKSKPILRPRTHRADLGDGLSVEIAIDWRGQLRAIWAPALPQRLSPEQMAAYRAARDSLLADVAAEIGGSVVVAEV